MNLGDKKHLNKLLCLLLSSSPNVPETLTATYHVAQDDCLKQLGCQGMHTNNCLGHSKRDLRAKIWLNFL